MEHIDTYPYTIIKDPERPNYAKKYECYCECCGCTGKAGNYPFIEYDGRDLCDNCK